MDPIVLKQTLNDEDASSAERAAAALNLRNQTRNQLDRMQQVLTKKQATLRGLETKMARGRLNLGTGSFAIKDAERNVREVQDVVDELTRQRDEYHTAYELHAENARTVERMKAEVWTRAIADTYPEYAFASWTGGVEISHSLEGRRVEVSVYFPRQMWGGRTEPAKVNFSALGSIAPQDARRYARMVQAAADIADQATADKLIVD